MSRFKFDSLSRASLPYNCGIMLKSLAIFVFVFLIFPISGRSQANRTQEGARSYQPAAATPTDVPEPIRSPSLRSEPNKHVDANVRVVSTAPKDGYDKAAFWVNCALALIGTFGIIAAFMTLLKLERQTKATEDQVRIAQQTLVHTQRPKIAVRTLYFSEMRSVGLPDSANGIRKGSFANGQLYIVNTGGTKASIEEIFCTPYIGEGANLPAKRPYEGNSGGKVAFSLVGGQSTPWTFALSEPLTEDRADILNLRMTSFYILGWIDYRDDLGILRTTRFCRRYDTVKERFVAVDDIEYESAD